MNSNMPNPNAPAAGDMYNTSIGRIVVCDVIENVVLYYCNGEKCATRAEVVGAGRSAGAREFAMMLRSIETVTPVSYDVTKNAITRD